MGYGQRVMRVNLNRKREKEFVEEKIEELSESIDMFRLFNGVKTPWRRR